MSKFWTCDKCQQRINPGEEGRVRWWVHLYEFNVANSATLREIEILCMGCHAPMPSVRGEHEVEFWHYVDDFSEGRWVRVFMELAQDETMTVANIHQFAKMVNRVVNGDDTEDAE